MNEPDCQRWHARRSSYRPAGEPIDPRRFGVDLIDEAPARAFVQAHHYSATMPAACVRVGLFRHLPHRAEELVGVAVFSVGVQPKAMLTHAGTAAGLELGRLVLLDDVEANGESWFVSRAFRLLQSERPELRAVLSYSDPVPRTTTTGHLVMPGHVGTVYQALSARHVGHSAARWLWLAPDGRVVSERSLSKIRQEDRGAAYALAQLIGWGAPKRALREGPFRRVKHPGNIAYVWAVGAERKATEAAFPAARPYPKRAAMLAVQDAVDHLRGSR